MKIARRPALRLLRVMALTILLLPASRAMAATPADACTDLHRAVAAMPAGPVLLPSFPSAGEGPLHQAAFLYDNAVAVIALIGCGQLAAAQRIGDAMVYAQGHDRYWHDGRLRNGYAAGSIGTGPIKLAGWWDKPSQSWLEDRYQAGSDSGNLAWAMLALLTLDRHAANAGKTAYLDSALRLGTWLRQMRDRQQGKDDPGGFRGGTFGHEPQPEIVTWKSTEHNTDLAAAYTALARITGDTQWLAEAQAAGAFITAMWQANKGCFATGTGADGKSRNNFVALDAQIWPLLALPDMAETRNAVTQRCLPGLAQKTATGAGYAYSQALHGIWTEGTAQAALLMHLTGRASQATALLATIDRLQAPEGGFYATDQADLPTGFVLPTDPRKPRLYFHLPHLGATAWVALAQRNVNPFAVHR
jgi:hypothetical protein